MAKEKVTQDGPGKATEETVKLARLAGNVAVLRELDALARALLREMEETDMGALLQARVQLLGATRSKRIAKMIRLMEMLPDVEAYRVARALWPYIAPEFFPRPHVSLSDAWARGLLPALSEEENHDRKLRIQHVLNTMRSTKKDAQRFKKAHGEMPRLPKDRRELADVAARSYGLSAKDVDRLMHNSEHAKNSRARRQGKVS